MSFTIYLRKNLINGMQYVGQTKNFKRRERDWKELSTRYANKYINDARKYFGLENWSVEIIEECESRENALKLEEYYIKKYNTLYPNGYNLTKGGKGCKMKHKQETRIKISESKKGKTPWNKGKKMSQSQKDSISAAKKGIPNKKLSKAIIQVKENGEIVKWTSMAEAEKIGGYNHRNISMCCKGKRSTHANSRWFFDNNIINTSQNE